jgi:alkylhydroperoxidase/carboxymuconolactone decarboxylase family protein YurZ
VGRSILEFVYGDIYLRPGLSLRDVSSPPSPRSSRSAASQIPQHLRAALKVGVTPDELREVILQTAAIMPASRRP